MVEKNEKTVLYLAMTLMLVFAFLVFYASMGLGVSLPTCNDQISPIKEGKVIPKDNNRFEVHYVAKMWSFEPAELVLPENADVDFYISALDVQHGFEVPGTNLNLMAIPGTVNAGHQHFKGTADYLVICHEYCGLNHQNMSGKIRVISAPDYTKYQQELASRTLAAGEKIANDHQCLSCHTVDGTEGIGPSFKGLYGKHIRLNDGSEVLVDDTYLMDSINHPDHQIVMNYDKGSMPPTEPPLTLGEMQQLVDYIKALK
jgi:cytochrome c oxidase subunit II